MDLLPAPISSDFGRMLRCYERGEQTIGVVATGRKDRVNCRLAFRCMASPPYNEEPHFGATMVQAPDDMPTAYAPLPPLAQYNLALSLR